jgi:hypothetical protein
MRNIRLLQIIVLMSLAASSVAVAGPITGDSMVQPINNEENQRADRQERETAVAFDAGSLFDVVGMPFLRLAAPIYLQMNVATGAQSSSGDPSGAIESFSSGGGGTSLGNLAFQPATDTVSTGAGGLGTFVVPEPATMFLFAPAALLLARRVAASRRPRQ